MEPPKLAISPVYLALSKRTTEEEIPEKC